MLQFVRKMSAPISSGRILCHISEIRLDRILVNGQSFRWKEENPGIWTGVLFDKILKLWQSETTISYQIFGNTKQESGVEVTATDSSKKIEVATCLKEPNIVPTDSVIKQSVKGEEKHCENSYEDLIKDYFQLNIKVGNLYQKWSDVDSNFQSISSKFGGIRILRQDPVENLFSFICSSNNHISRISSMVEKLCENYGREVGKFNGKTYFSFPTIFELSEDGVESELRNLGFGYRAKYINKSAQQILEKGGETWLRALREIPYAEAKKELLALNGVGAKVADCVCLMSLDKTDALPVDTHVWQIAARGYMPSLSKCKSLTDKLYNEIGDHFRTLWGPYAGWAQAVLFTADLRQFKEKDKIPSSKSKTDKSSGGSKSPAKKRKMAAESEAGANKAENQKKMATASQRKQKRKS